MRYDSWQIHQIIIKAFSKHLWHLIFLKINQTQLYWPSIQYTYREFIYSWLALDVQTNNSTNGKLGGNSLGEETVCQNCSFYRLFFENCSFGIQCTEAPTRCLNSLWVGWLGSESWTWNGRGFGWGETGFDKWLCSSDCSLKSLLVLFGSKSKPDSDGAAESQLHDGGVEHG